MIINNVTATTLDVNSEYVIIVQCLHDTVVMYTTVQNGDNATFSSTASLNIAETVPMIPTDLNSTNSIVTDTKIYLEM